MSKSQMKTELITFVAIKGIIYFLFIPHGQTVNLAYYVKMLKRLSEAVNKKQLELSHNDWILHHDNAPAHTAICQEVSGPKIDY
jgi:predicted ATPase